MPLAERLFYPEKWLFIRWLANADPRYAGAGNMVNCGAAMYAAPIGIVNACDPLGAYQEAVDVLSPHQVSFRAGSGSCPGDLRGGSLQAGRVRQLQSLTRGYRSPRTAPPIASPPSPKKPAR